MRILCNRKIVLDSGRRSIYSVYILCIHTYIIHTIHTIYVDRILREKYIILYECEYVLSGEMDKND